MFAIVSLCYSSRIEYVQLISNRQLGLMIGVYWEYGQKASSVGLELLLDFAQNLIVLPSLNFTTCFESFFRLVLNRMIVVMR